jgi:hypothetical protein
MRASTQGNSVFPLRKVDIQVSASNSPMKSMRDSYFQESPAKDFRNTMTMETDVSMNYDGLRSTMGGTNEMDNHLRHSTMST